MTPEKIIKFFISWSFVYIPVILLINGVATHNGYKEGYSGYFSNAALVSILLVTVTTKSFGDHLFRGVIGLIIIVIAKGLFWSYMDHPWFAGPETNTCDGPCFGWFSFENEDFGFLYLFAGVPIVLFLGVIKAAIFNLIKIKSKPSIVAKSK